MHGLLCSVFRLYCIFGLQALETAAGTAYGRADEDTGRCRPSDLGAIVGNAEEYAGGYKGTGTACNDRPETVGGNTERRGGYGECNAEDNGNADAFGRSRKTETDADGETDADENADTEPDTESDSEHDSGTDRSAYTDRYTNADGNTDTDTSAKATGACYVFTGGTGLFHGTENRGSDGTKVSLGDEGTDTVHGNPPRGRKLRIPLQYAGGQHRTDYRIFTANETVGAD